MSGVCRAPCYVRVPSRGVHRRERLDTRRRRAAAPQPLSSPPLPLPSPLSRRNGNVAVRSAGGAVDVANECRDGGGGGGDGGGVVHLIGAGPGGLDNLTVRALRLLRTCDVVVYDDLGAADVIEQAADAQHIYVGKRGGKEGSWKQVDIDQLLVRLCLEGRRVARLKGGCPSVFSRAHSEIAALTAARCAFDLVPGWGAWAREHPPSGCPFFVSRDDL